MSTFERFEDIQAWQRARTLNKRVYDICRTGTLSPDWFLANQLRSSSISVMSAIAEGFDRGGNIEFLQFLSIAKASAAECRSHLYAALDAEHVSSDVFGELSAMTVECGRMIGGLMTYLRKSSSAGVKFVRAANRKRSRQSRHAITPNSELRTPNSTGDGK